MDDDLEAARNELHEANATLGWYIGPTSYEPRLAVPWALHDFDPSGRTEDRTSRPGVDRYGAH